MCNERKQGKRKCDICTGCGRCVAPERNTKVVSVMPLWEERRAFYSCGESRQRDGISQTAYFITVDIGTTTVAMQLHDAQGTVIDQYAFVNPEVTYGADVLSRIQAAVEDSRAAEDMKNRIRQNLLKGIAFFMQSHSMVEKPHLIIAANTTMVYLLMGWDVEELGRAPFHVSHPEAVEEVWEGYPIYIFPPMSAFVGGDITAGILACGMTEREPVTLLIDLGTNGELVLGNRHKVIACSTAAGPAFEGGVNRGVWGADMIGILAQLRKMGAVDETGLLQECYFESGVRIEGVHVTQEAIRAVQLAKGAIMAGIRILTKQFGTDFNRIDRVILAGGFGYHLSPKDAAEIGLLPTELAQKAMTGGNTALTGALCMEWERRLDKKECCPFWERPELEKVFLNLAEVAEFQDYYFSSMNLEELSE